MKDLINEARELCAVATPGQWKRHDTADYAEIHNGDTWGKALSPIALVGYTEDADFIARSRTLIPELCDALEKAQAEIERLREAQRWVPVSERLPEIDVAVLVMHNYQSQEYSPITIGRLFQPSDKRRKPYWTFVSVQASDGSVYNDGTDFICPGSEFVTHWMPLPAPPEKEGEGK